MTAEMEVSSSLLDLSRWIDASGDEASMVPSADRSTFGVREIRGIPDPSRIPFGVAAFQYFQTLLLRSSRNQSEVLDHLREALGLTTEDASAFLAYLKVAIQRLNEFGPLEVSRVCQRKSDLRNVEALVAAMNSINAAVEKKRIELVKGAAEAIGIAGVSALERHVNGIRSEVFLVEVDYLAWIRDEGLAPTDVLSRMCR